MKGRESAILRDCLYCFAHHGFQVLAPGWRVPYEVDLGRGVAWRVNVGALRDRSGRHFVRYGINGMSDIMGFVSGTARTLGFEVKRPGESPTDLQRWFGRMLAEAGGLWGWGSSYDDCDRWLKEAGL